MNDICVTLITVDTPKRRDYLARTLTSLDAPRFEGSPRLHSFRIVDSIKGQRTASENAAEALRIGSESGAKWVLFLEDDIEVCSDFLGSVGRWLDEYDRTDRRVYSFFTIHPFVAQVDHDGWDYPVAVFCCTQAFAIRGTDARSLAEFLKAHPVWTGPDGLSSSGCYDLTMRDWSREFYPDLEFFLGSKPSFVQHTGDDSEISAGRPRIVSPLWGGKDWSYQ